MATIQHYKDLICWQKAMDLNEKVFFTTNGLKHYSLKDQIQRAALSVINNIAEGFTRPGSKEKARFLNYAIGSCNEVECMTFLMERIEIAEKKTILEIRNMTIEVFKMTTALRNHIMKSTPK